MSESKIKKVTIDQYKDAVDKFAKTFSVYQKLAKFKIKRSGSEIIELEKHGLLDTKGKKINPRMNYEADVQEWQFIDHAKTITNNLRQQFHSGQPIDLTEIFENYKKWITDFVEVQVKTNPKEYRIVTLEDYKKFLEEKRNQQQGNKEKKESIIGKLISFAKGTNK